MSKSLLLITPEDLEYAHELKAAFGADTPYVISKPIDLLVDLTRVCAQGNITKIISTNTAILAKLLFKLGNPKDNPKLSQYAGSFFTHEGIDIVFIEPLKQLFSVPYGKFIATRFVSKLTNPELWTEPTQFTWELAAPKNIGELYDKFSNARFITADIETLKHNLVIRCIGYCAVFIRDDGSIHTHCIVLPINSVWALHWMRKFNSLKVHKVFQNGKYDNAYLLRYNAPVSNWYGDTAHFMHSLYSELPKDLAFLNAFFLRKVVYWKDLAETSDIFEYYRYNAMDCWATANVWIQQLLSAPSYALRNYLLEFPLVYPCLLSECTGLLRDEDRLLKSIEFVDKKIAELNESFRRIVGVPKFNSNSPLQVKKLLHALGCKDWPSTGEKDIKKAMFLHPLNNVVLNYVPEIRGNVKLKGTYLGHGETSKDYRGTLFYSLNPHYTDTGRLASGESAFWCGGNIQNIPAGWEVKATIRSPDGFYLAESDLEQAESRDTGYISGDEAIITAVSGERDFHSSNASAMSGIPYDDIYDSKSKKPKNKVLRQTFKKVGHGANYNMGYNVLVDSMGLISIYEAKAAMKLPYSTPEEICEYLLCRFHMTFTKLKGITKIRHDRVREDLRLPDSPHKLYAPNTYYAAVVQEVRNTKRLTSRAFHHTLYNTKTYNPEKYIEEGDWTRVCFGKPWDNKMSLNTLVAHPPQSLNSRTLNEAYMEVFYKVALPYSDHFRLYAQIHDSILFSYRCEYEFLGEMVRSLMEIPVTVRDVFGKVRTFTVPAALKEGKYLYNPNGTPVVDDYGNHFLQRARYWSETE